MTQLSNLLFSLFASLEYLCNLIEFSLGSEQIYEFWSRYVYYY